MPPDENAGNQEPNQDKDEKETQEKDEDVGIDNEEEKDEDKGIENNKEEDKGTGMYLREQLFVFYHFKCKNGQSQIFTPN